MADTENIAKDTSLDPIVFFDSLLSDEEDNEAWSGNTNNSIVFSDSSNEEDKNNDNKYVKPEPKKCKIGLFYFNHDGFFIG